MIKALKSIANYLWVGALPNTLAGALLYDSIENLNRGEYDKLAGNGLVALINVGLGLKKFIDYKKIKKALEVHGWDGRIVRPKSYFWCDRHLTKQACRQVGYLEEYKAFMKQEGHKWFHLFPKLYRFNEFKRSVDEALDV